MQTTVPRSRKAGNARGAFTLIEMLIVVVILATLMSITFKLMSVGDDSSRRVTTVMRIQKLENCLSGYLSAFGSYPPVKLHGSQDISYAVGGHGIQTYQKKEISWSKDSKSQNEAWEQIQAACKAQPVACRYPFPNDWDDAIVALSEDIKKLVQDGEGEFASLTDARKTVLMQGFDSLANNPGRFGGRDKTDSDWRDIQIFQFGLMSFLLPRYLFMMTGPDHFFNGTGVAQWTGSNTLPCDPFMGNQYNSWKTVKDDSMKDTDTDDFIAIANIPSQTACARWMPNLAGMCACNHNYSFFGTSIRTDTALNVSPQIEIFSPDEESSNGTSGQYILDEITVEDGWRRPIYYYSPPPYQSYTIWSGGPNAKTFPPWVSLKDISNQTALEIIASWTIDDILHMNN